MARASHPQLREPRFESCAIVKVLAFIFTLHCSSSSSCMNEYLAINRGGYLLRIVFMHYLQHHWVFQREVKIVPLNRSTRE